MRRYRIRWPLAALLLPVAVAAAMAVMAFSRAQVASGTTMSIVSTNAAALAVLSVDGSYAQLVNNQIVLSFPNQQPGSTYTYNNVFKVQNRTPATISLSVAKVTGETSPGAHITLTDASTGTVYWQNGPGGSRSLTSMIEATMHVTIVLDSGVAIGAPVNLTVTVNGQ